jgi:hypothetical protein
LLVTKEERGNNTDNDNPMAAFAYGLRAPETKRQYPKRFQNFLDFLDIAGTLDEQAKQFASKPKENPNWAQAMS